MEKKQAFQKHESFDSHTQKQGFLSAFQTVNFFGNLHMDRLFLSLAVRKTKFYRYINVIRVKNKPCEFMGSRDGVVVIALASYLRGPGSGHEWVKLVVGSLLCSERFFSGFSGFPLSSKINISKFQFDRMQDPENHFRMSGASWVSINNDLLLTEHEGRTGEYWPEVVTGQKKLCRMLLVTFKRVLCD